MKISDLSRRITLMEPFQSKDADGKAIQGWANRGEVWANIQHRPGSEVFQQARLEARDPATVAVRASSLSRRLTSMWRIETDRVIYEISSNPNLSQDNAFVTFQVEGQRK